MQKQIQIVWLKRDLRISDHAAFKKACEVDLPTLVLYIWEPSLLNAPDHSFIHWRFIAESLQNLKGALSQHKIKVHQYRGEVVAILNTLMQEFDVKRILSHEETGTKITYDRDKSIKVLCKSNNVQWIEYQQFGVQRGRINRASWGKDWYDFMGCDLLNPDFSIFSTVEMDKIPAESDGEGIYEDFLLETHDLQRGGEEMASRYVATFLAERHKNYNKNISKPLLARKSCSRLSPYLAYGNISVREVYQRALKAKVHGNKSALNAFLSRLRWHCHFIQKFEMEPRYEFENLNSGFDQIRQEENEILYQAWEEGTTGFPMVDACMNCLKQTGYINFRMRAMLVSFLCFHLWQPWKRGALHLGRLFLDFEPGIHYPQFQMQAGVTGINTIRIYNPVKQSLDHDATAEFILKWVPSLKKIPSQFVHFPWKLSLLEQQTLGFILGEDYPEPIIDLESAARKARAEIWEMRKHPKVKMENKRILATHTTEKRVV
ncbi:MAG: deoxyribodipyrimidine photo-lyase [Marivirga sp.]|jgi:deoxyribodipyrimidine photo-lyase